ncbi:Cupredoxin [Mycena albidolilacea]|uniref:Cupredoxin n=1 Tax=Mycena albidolilacea TaxID=1033008 RepID=A0AAD7ASN2_9AGAR|nr:Cupredoxin [Mycena albidolilacea]
MHFFALASLALVSSVSAADILVKVGENNGLTYNPSNVTAAVGDNIIFQFIAKNHTVTQSTFASPCEIMTTPVAGIDSDFQNVPANATQIPQWSFTVNNISSPLWFFCRQTGHCAKGMVFSVNAPGTGKTFDAFKAAAMGGSTNASGATASGTPPPSGAVLTRASTAGLVAVAAGVVAGLVL